jgi:hypothetical protein
MNQRAFLMGDALPEAITGPDLDSEPKDNQIYGYQSFRGIHAISASDESRGQAGRRTEDAGGTIHLNLPAPCYFPRLLTWI